MHRLKGLMTCQLWCLQDLRDGGSLGFTIELFLFALRQLSSASSSPKLNQDLYTGTFNVITSGWEKSRNSSGTQRVLLNLVCDLIIKDCGVFSDFSYPEYIVEMLLELLGNMVKLGIMGTALGELWNVNSRDVHQQDDTQLEYWNFWSCWATGPSHPRLRSPLIPPIPANLVFQ